MKQEIGAVRPEALKDQWPGQYKIFSHFEFISGVPQALFLLTTLKENGRTNACLHCWSAFSGDGGGFFAVLTGLMQHTHTYRNILREKEFCVNFVDPSYYEACLKTIRENGDETDEFAAGGFTQETAVAVKSPRIKEAFLCYECRLESAFDLSGAGVNALVVGRVVHAAVQRELWDAQTLCGEFMYNIHSPTNPVTGRIDQGAVAQLRAVRNG